MLTLATRCHNVCNSMIDVYRPVTEVTAVSESMLCIIYLCDNISLVRWSLCVMDYVYTSQLLRLYMHTLYITTSQSFLLFIYTIPIFPV